jgi:MoaA/NifB/PqqE/SkfB family radical SAM enzyme
VKLKVQQEFVRNTEIVEKVPTPTYVQIEPVGQCNLRCKMCPINFRDDSPLFGKQKFMSFELYTSLIDQFENLQSLHLQGLGEPMMHPRFFDMVEYAVEKGIRVTTNTNLTLLNNRRAQKCISSGLDGVFFSIDGARRETYENIRVNARYDKVLANLELLGSTKAAQNSLLPHLKMVMVIMRQNLMELPDLVDLAANYAIEEVYVQQLSHDFGESSFTEKFKPLHDYVDEQTLLGEDPERIEQYFQEARQRAAQNGVGLRLPPTRPRLHSSGTPGQERCDWPWTSAYISFQGYMMPCCMVSTPELINFGLVNHHNLEEIWNGPEYTDFRRQLSSDQPHPMCGACSIYKGIF